MSLSAAHWLPMSGFAVRGALGGAQLHWGCPPEGDGSSGCIAWVVCPGLDLGAQPSVWVR